MSIIEFDYTDVKNKKTHRRAYIVRLPSEMYLTLDLTDLSPDEEERLVKAMASLDEIRDEIFAEIKDLIKWRTFKPSKMDLQKD